MSKCRLISMLLIFSLILSSFVAIGNTVAFAEEALIADLPYSDSYGLYTEEYDGEEFPKESYVLDTDDIISAANTEIYSVDGKNGVLLSAVDDYVMWQFDVVKKGLYTVSVEYRTIPNGTGDIALSLEVNGSLPFSDAASLSLPRVWQDEKKDRASENEDDVRPTQKEISVWQVKYLRDITGLYSNPYSVYFSENENTLKLTLSKESLYISRVIIRNEGETVAYKEYISQYSDADYAKGDTLRIEAEKADIKSSSVLYPTYDRTSAATFPNDPVYVRLNTIGAGNWSTPTQSITWTANVEKSGLYILCYRARQDTKQGLSSYRTLYINGQVPFKEAESIAFPYEDSWYNKILGDEKPYYVYLKKGDKITLECTPGPTDTILQKINSTVRELNAIYRQIIQITGIDPDIYRDYSLTTQLPNLLKDLNSCRKDILNAYNKLLEIAGQDAAQASVMKKAAKTLERMIREPNTIAERLSTFLEDSQSLATLISDLGGQPLELDCIACVTKDGETPAVSASFGQWIAFSVKKFISSFTTDYMTIGTDSNNSINVWVSTGRDQATVINDIIKDMYTSQTGVAVKLAMVDTGTTLIRAVLAGKGPDAALMIPMTSPINLAMRGALIDLNTLGLDEDFMSEFSGSAWTPFEYRDGIYAIPESQYYDMLFYRKDIFSEYGLKVPDTWEDFYEAMRVVQNNNLVVGLPESQSTFNYFLFQNGGKYYNDNLDATLFDTEVANKAFEEWTQLYSKYTLDRSLDFYNRFRSGEMPFGIAGFSMCNQLYSAAPELNGLWAMAPIPGTVQENGEINRLQASVVTASIVINTHKGIESYKKAFDFVRWWTGSKAQSRYALDIEASIGIAARYAPANLKAYESINWSAEDREALNSQLEWLYNNPEIPGNYIITRCITNAFRTVVDEGKNARRQLAIYNTDINEEITRKLKEFNPETGE